MRRLIDWIFAWLQERCEHRPEWVKADILEGDHHPYQVEWCERCGAYRHFYLNRVRQGVWVFPRANWVREGSKT